MRVLITMAVLTLSVQTAAAANLLTISVPVEVTNLHPDITKIKVGCHIKGKDAVTQNDVNYGPTNGKSKEIPISSSRSYKGTVTLSFATEDFNAKELKNVSSVHQGACRLHVFAAGQWYSPYGDKKTGVLGVAPGTPFKSIANFVVPK